MIANAIYDLLPIPTETLIVAGILVGLGLGYLFPDHDNEKNKLKEAKLITWLLFYSKFFLKLPFGPD